MKTMLNKLKNITKRKKIDFCDRPYLSQDGKTIMGEVAFKEILFLDYRETEAGSNPREYYGLKKTNLVILKSLLEHPDMFRFLHSGIIVSLSDTTINDNSIRYGDCCLTNGNQTRFIVLILTLLKFLVNRKSAKSVDNKKYSNFIKTNFGDNNKIFSFLNGIKFSKIDQIATFLTNNSKYLKDFEKISIDDLLNIRVRIQLNLLDEISEDLEETKLDNYSIGSLIAEANNDTQNVRVDDIFGNRYKKELETFIFKEFLQEYKDTKIEYRMGEIADKDKVHILTLLRPLVALGILTKEKDVYEYTNQRAPVYKLFERLLRVKDKAKNTIEVISKLIPLLYSIRINYVAKQLELEKRRLIREYKTKAVSGDLSGTIITKEVSVAKGDEKQIEKIVKKHVSYNIEHIIPVLVYRIRKLFKEPDSNGKIGLVIPDENVDNFFKGLIETIYKGYVDLKLQGLPTSLTTVVRSSEFYKKGEEAYIALKNAYNFDETGYIENNKYIIS